MKQAINFRSKLAQLPGKPQKDSTPSPLLAPLYPRSWARPQRPLKKDADMPRQRVGEWR